MYKEFLSFCQDRYSFSRTAFQTETPSPHLFSFQTVKVSQDHFEKIKKFISAIYKVRNQSSYQQEVLGHHLQHKNFGVLMSFDFHILKDQLKLIEINTNASHFLTSYLLADFMRETKNVPLPVSNSLDLLKASFQKEYELFSGGKKLSRLAIIDEKPPEQRAYFEFLMYQKLFQENAWDCSIEDSKTIKPESFDLIYNRDTDFFFDKLPQLRKAYIEKLCCISPHPEEYQLLADKNRMIQLSNESFLGKYLNGDDLALAQEIIPKIFEMHSVSEDELWTQRKKYFFKPKNAFGGKGVFKGASVSKKVFKEVYSTKNYLAQEFAEPGTIMIQDQVSHQTEAKWDLRVYVYAGEVQHVSARAYVGQTTNFRTLGGGFAAVALS